MKKILLTIGVVTLVAALTGCSQGDNANGVEKSLSDVQIKNLPKFNVDKIQKNYSKEKDQKLSVKDTLVDSYIGLVNKPKGCFIDARVSYLPSYQEGRGDTFNSKEYLYSLTNAKEDMAKFTGYQTINKLEFVVGTYKANGKYNKVAIRAFSNLEDIKNTSGTEKNELGNYNSSLTKGLPILTINYSCNDRDLITDASWKKVTENIAFDYSRKE